MAKGAASGGATHEHSAKRPGHAPTRLEAAKRALPAAFVLAGLALGYALGLHRYLSLDYLSQSRDALQAFVALHPALAPLAFFALYTTAVAISFPAASVLTIFAGFLFGWAGGGLLAILSATCGSTLLFLAARTAFGGFLRRRVGSKAAKLAEGFRSNAFGYLLVLRLVPLIPFVIVNITPALFDVRLRTFILATFLGIMPGSFAYAWLGEGVDSVLLAAQASGQRVTLGDLVTPQIIIAFAALALVAALATLIRRRWAPVET